MDEQGDLVACPALDDLRFGRHPLHRGQPVEEAGEGAGVALLRHPGEIEDPLERGIRTDGRRRRQLVHAQRPHGREHPRIRPGVGGQRHARVAEATGQNDHRGGLRLLGHQNPALPAAVATQRRTSIAGGPPARAGGRARELTRASTRQTQNTRPLNSERTHSGCRRVLVGLEAAPAGLCRRHTGFCRWRYDRILR